MTAWPLATVVDGGAGEMVSGTGLSYVKDWGTRMEISHTSSSYMCLCGETSGERASVCSEIERERKMEGKNHIRKAFDKHSSSGVAAAVVG